MNKDLIEELSRFYYEAVKGVYISEFSKITNGIIAYSDTIKDFFSNYIQMDSATKDDFYREWKENRKYLIEKDRQAILYVFPDTNLSNHREEYLEDNFKLISRELWQIYDNFAEVENIETNCSLNIKLQKITDMELYANIDAEGFNTNDENDPYGNLDTSYKEALSKYKNINKDYTQEFHVAYNENTPVGAVNIVYNDSIIGIYGFTVLQKYRKKGIGKNILKQLLLLAKEKNFKLVFLQTEQGYYPEKMYSKMGFKDLSVAYVYAENPEFSRKLDK